MVVVILGYERSTTGANETLNCQKYIDFSMSLDILNIHRDVFLLTPLLLEVSLYNHVTILLHMVSQSNLKRPEAPLFYAL